MLLSLGIEDTPKANAIFVAGILEKNPDFTEKVIRDFNLGELQIKWWSENIKAISRVSGSELDTAANILLENLSAQAVLGTSADYFQLVLSFALALPGMTIPAAAKRRITAWAEETSLSEENAPLVILALATSTRLKKEQNERLQSETRLQNQILSLKGQVENLIEESNKSENAISELTTGYHMPEKWVSYRAKKEILERLGQFYQEILADSGCVDKPEINWILNQVETILIKNGVIPFGERNKKMLFDPAEHQFINPVSSHGNEIKMLFPGFALKDPLGNTVILVRAKVEPV
jgi:hypothetical protein